MKVYVITQPAGEIISICKSQLAAENRIAKEDEHDRFYLDIAEYEVEE